MRTRRCKRKECRRHYITHRQTSVRYALVAALQRADKEIEDSRSEGHRYSERTSHAFAGVYSTLSLEAADMLGYCSTECAEVAGAIPLPPWHDSKLLVVAAASAAPGDGTSTPPASETAEDALVEVDTGPLPSGTTCAGGSAMSEYIIDDNYGLRFSDSDGVPMNVLCSRCGHVNGAHYAGDQRCGENSGCDCPGFEPTVARSGADA
jgi:hypothetical protein